MGQEIIENIQKESGSQEILQKEIYTGPILQESQNENKTDDKEEKALKNFSGITGDDLFLTYAEQRTVQELSKIAKELKEISKELHESNKHQKEISNKLEYLRGRR